MDVPHGYFLEIKSKSGSTIDQLYLKQNVPEEGPSLFHFACKVMVYKNVNALHNVKYWTLVQL